MQKSENKSLIANSLGPASASIRRNHVPRDGEAGEARVHDGVREDIGLKSSEVRSTQLSQQYFACSARRPSGPQRGSRASPREYPVSATELILVREMTAIKVEPVTAQNIYSENEFETASMIISFSFCMSSNILNTI